jgi:hypothetical protein
LKEAERYNGMFGAVTPIAECEQEKLEGKKLSILAISFDIYTK